MTKSQSNPSRTKDPLAIKIGKRIAQARKMAGFSTAKAFRERLPKWPENRLAWYEAGYSMPHPNDVAAIAQLTGTSACWIMFGLGPIRSGGRDLQAVRHQNLVYLYQQANDRTKATSDDFCAAMQLLPATLAEHIDNPFKQISDRLARRSEKAGGRPRGWLDEQHVESDGLCASFPDELRELMTIYSEMQPRQRNQLIEIARTLNSR